MPLLIRVIRLLMEPDMIPSTHYSILDTVSPSAWEKVVVRYRDTIAGWCRRSNIPEDDIQDLTHDILLTLRTRLEEGKYDRERGMFRKYLRVVVRSAVDHFFEYRNRRPDARGVGGTVNAEQLPNIPDQQAINEVSDIIETGLFDDLRTAVERAADRASPENREAILRVLLHGESAVEVARELGKSPSAIYVAIDRVKRKVRDEFPELLNPAP